MDSDSFGSCGVVQKHPLTTTPPITVVGIDVGGARKGFHAVALRDGAYAAQLSSLDVRELSHWSRSEIGASVIAIDAPCRWSGDGRARPCERALMRQGIFCFATPSREKAEQHPSGYFDWMRRGADLYEALKPSHPLLTSLPSTGQRCCFETFPPAITWHLRNGEAKARQKRPQRTALLTQAGINTASLTSIDWIDAALCALTSHRVASGGECVSYGEPESGWIVVPRGPAGAGQQWGMNGPHSLP
jgi:predicted nuclease with RNAse H fold